MNISKRAHLKLWQCMDMLTHGIVMCPGLFPIQNNRDVVGSLLNWKAGNMKHELCYCKKKTFVL